MTRTNLQAKSTSLNLSEQVKEILNSKGLSSIFNYSDYQYFKSRVKNAFNKAQAIAELFISENNTKSDFDEYVF